MIRGCEDRTDKPHLVVFKRHLLELTIHHRLGLEGRGGLLDLSSQDGGRGGEELWLENININTQLELLTLLTLKV